MELNQVVDVNAKIMFSFQFHLVLLQNTLAHVLRRNTVKQHLNEKNI